MRLVQVLGLKPPRPFIIEKSMNIEGLEKMGVPSCILISDSVLCILGILIIPNKVRYTFAPLSDPRPRAVLSLRHAMDK